jgi:hypothetical protein
MSAFSHEPWLVDRLRASCASELRAVARRMIRRQKLTSAQPAVDGEDRRQDWHAEETLRLELESTRIHG